MYPTSVGPSMSTNLVSTFCEYAFASRRQSQLAANGGLEFLH